MESPIIDPNTGKGFKKADKATLAQHITRATLTGIRQASPGYTVASALTPERLAAVLRNAIEGDATDYLVLAEEMEERDLHYATQLRTRKLAVSGLAPTVEAATDDERDIELADAVRELVRAPEFSNCLLDLLDALGKGFSVVEIVWSTSGKQWRPERYEWADPRFFKYDRETGRELRHNDHTVDGEPLEPYKYMVHTPKMKSGLPIRNGLARLAATMYMLKGYTIKDWWAFAELFGMPIRVGKYGPNATDTEIETLVNAIANIASDAGAAIPESMKLEFIESAKATGGDNLFKVMADWADSQISKGVLGQTMTADNGSSRSQAEVHNDVRGDIQIDDARQLENTLNATLVRWFIDFNFGPQEQYPKICLPIIEPEDLKGFSDAVVPLIDRGMKVEASGIRDKFGLPDPEDDAELLHPQGQAPQQPVEPALNHQRLALNSQQDREQDLTDLEDELLAEWQPLLKPVLDPVQALADDCEDFEEFMARLPELLNEEGMDANALIVKLAQGTFKARGMGEAN
ncbi:DUF935 domain-containing protein [uncultured Endozoicomonas sp.]|uniref:DUF935 domain-containing protein n=1 Tax=uncultured Endozoicomonas sp. TaxID=432652 RepID=UPI0026272095|nr:DUF935 domain-containing protein [uncultured Endozoicomonas sp.]